MKDIKEIKDIKEFGINTEILISKESDILEAVNGMQKMVLSASKKELSKLSIVLGETSLLHNGDTQIINLFCVMINERLDEIFF